MAAAPATAGSGVARPSPYDGPIVSRRAALSARAHALAARVSAMPVLRQDACLYGLAAAFAAATSLFAVSDDYREWGLVSLGPYCAAAVVCELIARRKIKQGRKEPDAGRGASRVRRVVILLVLTGAVLVPLALQVTWRADAAGCVVNRHDAQAQPEVAVIERAGDRFARFEDPYLRQPKTVGISPSNDCHFINATSYFPYLPGMVPFGLANAAHVPRELNDARVPLAGFSLIVVLISLALVPATSRRRWRAFQFLVVLPTGALPMVTGGDDLPVLSLLLLGLVFAQRRQPVVAGLVMGLAGTLKWTAWPLILLAALAVRDDDDAPATIRYSLSVACVSFPVIGAGLALGAHAFVENAVLFPLGLAKVKSPAASPLPGQVIVQLFPGDKKVLTALLVGGGALVVLAFLVKHPPRTPYAAAFFAGWALAFATFIAPATRFGYLIYPANMLVWAYLLRERVESKRAGPAATADVPREKVQLASGSC